MLRKPTGIQIQQKLILTLCKTGRRGLKSTRGMYIIRESLERGGRPSGVNRTTIKSGYTYYIVGTNVGQGILSILKQTSYSMCKCVKGTESCNRMVFLARRRSPLWERFSGVLLSF